MAACISADDVEPWDADERCEAACGPHHIGRFEESHAELALIFDPRGLETWERETQLKSVSWAFLRPFNGHLHGCTVIGPTNSEERISGLLFDYLEPVRPCDFGEDTSVAIAVVDLPPDGVPGLHLTLANEPSYIGYANLSWPSDFRSIVYSDLNYS